MDQLEVIWLPKSFAIKRLLDVVEESLAAKGDHSPSWQWMEYCEVTISVGVSGVKLTDEEFGG